MDLVIVGILIDIGLKFYSLLSPPLPLAWGNLGVILVWVCEPVFQNLPHSYTWPLKKRTHSYT